MGTVLAPAVINTDCARTILISSFDNGAGMNTPPIPSRLVATTCCSYSAPFHLPVALPFTSLPILISENSFCSYLLWLGTVSFCSGDSTCTFFHLYKNVIAYLLYYPFFKKLANSLNTSTSYLIYGKKIF